MAVHQRLEQVVDALDRLGDSRIGHDSVIEILSAAELEDGSLRPFLHFSDDHYCRNLVHRTGRFDVMLLCWRPGQRTPVHNHNGQMGWVRVLRGRIEETHYQHPAGSGDVDLSTIEIDDDMVGHNVVLREKQHLVVPAGPGVVSVDRERPIHRLANPRENGGAEPAVTLHVYSLPHDSCLVFDVDQRTCWRRQLKFDTVPYSLDRPPAGSGPRN
jgi:cysteine dioxygenase